MAISLELTLHIGDAAMMLEKWNQTKQVQTDAAWVHDGSAAE